jgi:hypothetical protein
MNKVERFSPTDPLSGLFRGRSSVLLGGVPDGLEGRILGACGGGRHGPCSSPAMRRRLAQAETALAFFAPSVATLHVSRPGTACPTIACRRTPTFPRGG